MLPALRIQDGEPVMVAVSDVDDDSGVGYQGDEIPPSRC